MKKLLLLILLAIGCSGIFANEYEPEKILTEVNNDVALFFKDMIIKDLGITAVQTNIIPNENADLTIASANDKKFHITGLKCTSMVQALDASGGELAYTVTLYNVKKSALKKLNNAIKKNRIRFSKMLDVIGEKDLDAEMHGTQEAPDPKMFSRLRNVQVYDIFVTAEENKDVHLQVYAEYFQDAKDL